jgi:hypothetical protein
VAGWIECGGERDSKGSEHAFREEERQVVSWPPMRCMKECSQLRPVAFNCVCVRPNRAMASRNDELAVWPDCCASFLLRDLMQVVSFTQESKVLCLVADDGCSVGWEMWLECDLSGSFALVGDDFEYDTLRLTTNHTQHWWSLLTLSLLVRWSTKCADEEFVNFNNFVLIKQNRMSVEKIATAHAYCSVELANRVAVTAC